MKTQSFTLRIPADLMEEIKNKAGERSRSEFIIQTLREALNITPQTISTDPKIDSQIAELLNNVNVLQDQIKEIFNRVSKLEDKPTLITSVIETEFKLNKNENNNINEEDNLLLNIQDEILYKKVIDSGEESNLLLNVPDEIPCEARSIDSKELLSILRKEEPTRQWDVHKLRVKRQGKAATKWHTIENCKFIYKGPFPGDKKIHEWWAIYPLANNEPTTSSS